MVSPSSYQDLEVSEVDDVTVVRLTRRVLGDPEINTIGQTLFKLAEKSKRRKLILDFSDVAVLNSRDLGRLVALSKKVQEAEGWLTLSNANPRILEVLRTLHLTNFFEVREEE